MPALILVVVEPSGRIRELSYVSDKVESGFEFTSNLVNRGNDVLTVSLFDEGRCITLPSEVFDGGPFIDPIKKLEREWNRLLAL